MSMEFLLFFVHFRDTHETSSEHSFMQISHEKNNATKKYR